MNECKQVHTKPTLNIMNKFLEEQFFLIIMFCSIIVELSGVVVLVSAADHNAKKKEEILKYEKRFSLDWNFKGRGISYDDSREWRVHSGLDLIPLLFQYNKKFSSTALSFYLSSLFRDIYPCSPSCYPHRSCLNPIK